MLNETWCSALTLSAMREALFMAQHTNILLLLVNNKNSNYLDDGNKRSIYQSVLITYAIIIILQ